MSKQSVLIQLAVLAVIMAATCEAVMVGGRREIDVEEPGMKKTLEELSNIALKKIASKRMEAGLNGQNAPALNYSLIRVVSGQSQIVAGVNYFLKIRMKEADCKRNCKIELCDLTIYSRPWENKTELTDFSCQAKQSAIMLGGRIAVDTNDENALQAVMFGVDQISKQSNSLFHQRLISLLNVQRQIVRGIKYYLDFTMGQTSCMKNQIKFVDEEKCPVAANARDQKCTAIVIDEPWNTNGPRYQLSSFSCQAN